MSTLSDLRMYARFTLGLREYLRHTITLEEARAVVRQRLARREQNFLQLVERGIFGYQRSPYLPLLRMAQVELGDIQIMVRDKGLEGTLTALREAGVYVGFEEFKGLQPAMRNGQLVRLQPHDFDNPYLTKHFQAETGGSTGPATYIAHDLNHAAAQTPHHMLTREMHGVLGVPTALWRGILPDGSGINNILRCARAGTIPEKWFSQVVPNGRRDLKYYLASELFVLAGRLNGTPIPWPQWVPLNQAVVVARWAEQTLKTDDRCLILAQVSRALRVCLAAEQAGLDLDGAVFMIAGEPPTPAKVRGMHRVGARHFPTYGLAEVGRVGMGCGQPNSVNDVHLLRDAFGLIQYPRQVEGTGFVVPAFYITTLLPTSPKLMFNVEVDDYGVMEQRKCGCALEELGLDVHLSDIRSFRKLTGEGVTLAGSEALKVLEEVLPARFGGSPLDYQLLEEEDEMGFTRLSLLIDPEVGIGDENEVIEAVLGALHRGSVAADVAQRVWGEGHTLRIKRVAPIWTSRGKLMPLHIVHRAQTE